MSKKSCIFCGQPANSKEHLIPDWILVALGGVNPSVLKLRDRDTQVFTAPIVVRCVCKKTCNEGWMSALESDVKSVMTPMMVQDTPMSLNLEHQRLMSLWAVKTAMVGEETKTKHGQRFYTQVQRERLWLQREIPTSTRIEIGRFTGSGTHFDGTEVWWTVNGIPKAIHAHVTTIVVGHLAFQIISSRMTGSEITANYQVPIAVGRWDKLLQDIWPTGGGQVNWPPTLSFTTSWNEHFILDLENRWKIGEKV